MAFISISIKMIYIPENKALQRETIKLGLNIILECYKKSAKGLTLTEINQIYK